MQCSIVCKLRARKPRILLVEYRDKFDRPTNQRRAHSVVFKVRGYNGRTLYSYRKLKQSPRFERVCRHDLRIY